MMSDSDDDEPVVKRTKHEVGPDLPELSDDEASSSSAPPPGRYPPPAWAVVTVDGKPKRKCKWMKPDGSECGTCVGDSRQQFENHWRTHTGEKPFKCRHCDTAFTTSGTRGAHERSRHTGEKPYKCRHCPKAFATQFTRDTHERRKHTGEKSYLCQYCPKTFTTSSQRGVHERRHTKEKPYKCTHCPKAFAESGHRDMHERTHTGKKPFKCSRCDKTFTQRSQRNVHERTHRGEKANPCKGGEKGVCDGNRSGSFKYDDRCVKCFIDFAPNDIRAVNAKTHLHAKEQTVRLFLEQTFPEYRWVFDRSHAVGVLQRPDAKVAIGKTRLLIVEVDEHSHYTYDCAKEREREAILAKHAPKGAVIHLIRFNPDAYHDPVTGVRVPTCFKYSKVEGLTTINPARQADWDARLAKLKAVIDEIIAHKHEDIAVPECLLDDDRYGHVIPVELFYDNVREKWPDGNKQRLAAYKRNAQVRKLLVEGAKPPPLSKESEESENEESESEEVCLPCA